MLTRKELSGNTTIIPDSATQNISEVIEDTYKNELKVYNKAVEFYAQSSDDELLLVVSLIDKEDSNAIPTSFFLSTDITPKSDIQKYFEKMIDLFGILLDSYFNNQCSIEYSPNWSPVSEENEDYFYKINRENVALTIEANKLLEDN